LEIVSTEYYLYIIKQEQKFGNKKKFLKVRRKIGKTIMKCNHGTIGLVGKKLRLNANKT
jgi:hypothetical protein